MIIVLDANILFSALIKDSTIRKLILEYDGKFLIPAYIFQEMRKHKKELVNKSKMNEENFNLLLKIIVKKLKIVSNKELLMHAKTALEIVKNIDINDALFVACALVYENSIIWSEDKQLKKQNFVKIMNTEEIKIMMKK